jgi:hypothetical protein
MSLVEENNPILNDWWAWLNGCLIASFLGGLFPKWYKPRNVPTNLLGPKNLLDPLLFTLLIITRQKTLFPLVHSGMGKKAPALANSGQITRER